MIHFTLVVIIVQGAAPPVVQEQPPIVQVEQPLPPDQSLLRYDCPDCGWWNTYDNMTSFKIGHRAHFRRCPKR